MHVYVALSKWPFNNPVFCAVTVTAISILTGLPTSPFSPCMPGLPASPLRQAETKTENQMRGTIEIEYNVMQELLELSSNHTVI